MALLVLGVIQRQQMTREVYIHLFQGKGKVTIAENTCQLVKSIAFLHHPSTPFSSICLPNSLTVSISPKDQELSASLADNDDDDVVCGPGLTGVGSMGDGAATR